MVMISGLLLSHSAVTCCHLPSQAVTFRHRLSLAITCCHLPSHDTVYRHSLSHVVGAVSLVCWHISLLSSSVSALHFPLPSVLPDLAANKPLFQFWRQTAGADSVSGTGTISCSSSCEHTHTIVLTSVALCCSGAEGLCCVRI